jgi:hypothetical protein
MPTYIYDKQVSSPPLPHRVLGRPSLPLSHLQKTGQLAHSSTQSSWLTIPSSISSTTNRSARPLFHTEFRTDHPFLYLIYDKQVSSPTLPHRVPGQPYLLLSHIRQTGQLAHSSTQSSGPTIPSSISSTTNRSACPLFHTEFRADHPFLYLIYEKRGSSPPLLHRVQGRPSLPLSHL